MHADFSNSITWNTQSHGQLYGVKETFLCLFPSAIAVCTSTTEDKTFAGSVFKRSCQFSETYQITKCSSIACELFGNNVGTLNKI